MHWSAEFEEPCDGYSACVCTCPTSVYKRVHEIGAHAPGRHDDTRPRSLRMSVQKPPGELRAA